MQRLLATEIQYLETDREKLHGKLEESIDEGEKARLVSTREAASWIIAARWFTY